MNAIVKWRPAADSVLILGYAHVIMTPYDNMYGGVIMAEYTCKNCGKKFNRSGKKPAVFCSLDCKGEWQRNQKAYDRDWLYQKYIVEGLSTYQIAKLVQRNPKQVYNWIRDYGIQLRERAWDTEEHKPYHDKEWLIREYVEKQRSTGEIAADFGVNEAGIIHFMRRHGIKRRNTSEARAVKHWGQPGEKNPMYGKRGEDTPNWKGGCTPERQAFYNSLEWIKVAKQVWERDERNCQRCGQRWHRGRKFHIHHIVSFSVQELRAELNNLVLLCAKCHRWVHSNQNVDKDFLRDN